MRREQWTAAARIADDPHESADDSVPVATSGATGRRRKASATTTTPSSDTTPETPPNDVSGYTDTNSVSASASPASGSFVPPSSGSTRRWRQPRTVREFAAQANAVATMVLNGTMDLDAARTYSSVARTVAQAMSTEVSRSRFLATEPSLDIPQDVFEEPQP